MSTPSKVPNYGNYGGVLVMKWWYKEVWVAYIEGHGPQYVRDAHTSVMSSQVWFLQLVVSRLMALQARWVANCLKLLFFLLKYMIDTKYMIQNQNNINMCWSDRSSIFLCKCVPTFAPINAFFNRLVFLWTPHRARSFFCVFFLKKPTGCLWWSLTTKLHHCVVGKDQRFFHSKVGRWSFFYGKKLGEIGIGEWEWTWYFINIVGELW